MKTFYRIEETKNIEKMFETSYKSAHHPGRVSMFQDVDVSIFFKKEDIDVESLDICDQCGCSRISHKFSKKVALPLDNLPAPGEFEYETFCLELDGICALDSLQEIQAYFKKNYAYSDDRSEKFKIVEFLGEETGSIYDGKIVKPIELISILEVE